MTVSTTPPIKNALVRQIRHDDGPRSYVFPEGDARAGKRLSGNWLHEDFAPERIPYPIVVYQQFPSVPLVYTWGSLMVGAAFDIRVFSENSVEAENLFALVAAVLDEAELQVAQQSTLICRRVADLRNPDTDEEGRKIYMVGGTYLIWTDQPLPQTVLLSLAASAVIAQAMTASFVADAEIDV